ncbi:MAG: hypothetical protein JWR50_3234 [Mucilaginibacter sp.]|nr:hypothetical protein [Mucilaginibacter sp.]
MRNFIAIILFASAIPCNVFAQDKDALTPQKPATFPINLDITNRYNNAVLKPSYFHKLNKDTLDLAKKPLYFLKIDGSDAIFNTIPSLNLLDQGDISSMEILKDKMAIDAYGKNAKNGVIIISLIQGTEILQENKLLDKYNIDSKFRNLPLYVDSTLAHRSNQTFYASKKIKSVTVAEEKETGMKYISILTDNVMIK